MRPRSWHSARFLHASANGQRIVRPDRRAEDRSRRSALARGAVEARPPDDRARTDRGAAPHARLARAVVDAVLELEPALTAEAVAIVGDRRAATADRFREHGARR